MFSNGLSSAIEESQQSWRCHVMLFHHVSILLATCMRPFLNGYWKLDEHCPIVTFFFAAVLLEPPRQQRRTYRSVHPLWCYYHLLDFEVLDISQLILSLPVRIHRREIRRRLRRTRTLPLPASAVPDTAEPGANTQAYFSACGRI